MGIHHAHNTSSRRLLPLFHHVVADPEQIEQFQQTFEYCDKDDDGVISEADLRATLEALDFPASSVTEMVDDVRNGTMDSTKFMSMIGGRLGSMPEEQALMDAFSCLDPDNVGWIDENEFKRSLIEMGEHMAKHEVTDIMQAMKGSVRGGRVDIRDFVQMLLKR